MQPGNLITLILATPVIPAQAGIQWFYSVHSRVSGNALWMLGSVYHPGLALLDSSFRWNEDGALDAAR